MHPAARLGDLETVKHHVELLGESVDSRDHLSRTPLYCAALYGRTEVARYFIQKNCDLNLKCSQGLTPLLTAAGYGEKSVVNLLLQCGAKLDCSSKAGWTILHCASATGWLEIVQHIVNKKTININVTNSAGKTALMLAVSRSFEDVIEFLLQAGADVNISCSAHKLTALHIASQRGDEKAVKSLVKTDGCVVNAQDTDGDTALHLASRFKSVEVVKQLLTAKADVNIKNNRNETPLSECLYMFDFRVCKLLFQHGAFLADSDYVDIMSKIPVLKGYILQNEEFCFQSIVNKFNHQTLPAVYDNLMLAESLPRIKKLTIKRQQNVAREIEVFVKSEIQAKLFCLVTEVQPLVLKLMCVQSLVNYESATKRSAAGTFCTNHAKRSSSVLCQNSRFRHF